MKRRSRKQTQARLRQGPGRGRSRLIVDDSVFAKTIDLGPGDSSGWGLREGPRLQVSLHEGRISLELGREKRA